MNIAITQKVNYFPERNERNDSLDQEWGKLLACLGISPVIIPNSGDIDIGFLKRIDVKGIILTGGNDFSNELLVYLHLQKNDETIQMAPERDFTEKALVEWGIENKLPILGVCRGLQFLNLLGGGKIEKVEGHVRQKHILKPLDSEFKHEFYGKVNSYHNFAVTIDSVAPKYTVLAKVGGVVEAMKHRKLPIWAIMWHPERENSDYINNQWIFKHIFFNNKENNA